MPRLRNFESAVLADQWGGPGRQRIQISKKGKVTHSVPKHFRSRRDAREQFAKRKRLFVQDLERFPANDSQPVRCGRKSFEMGAHCRHDEWQGRTIRLNEVFDGSRIVARKRSPRPLRDSFLVGRNFAARRK